MSSAVPIAMIVVIRPIQSVDPIARLNDWKNA